jgi:hypothetical protein
MPGSGRAVEAPEGCGWTVEETPVGEDVLLYRALKCGAKTTLLAYKPGGDMAELAYERAAWGDDDNMTKGQVMVRFTAADPKDPQATILKIVQAAVEDPAERAKCKVRKAGIDGWPDDVLMVDSLTPQEAARVAEDGPRTAFGPMGLDEDSARFWRIFQGRAWHFDLGQDLYEFDPYSLTLMTKGKDGQWSQVE